MFSRLAAGVPLIPVTVKGAPRVSAVSSPAAQLERGRGGGTVKLAIALAERSRCCRRSGRRRCNCRCRWEQWRWRFYRSADPCSSLAGVVADLYGYAFQRRAGRPTHAGDPGGGGIGRAVVTAAMSLTETVGLVQPRTRSIRCWWRCACAGLPGGSDAALLSSRHRGPSSAIGGRCFSPPCGLM